MEFYSLGLKYHNLIAFGHCDNIDFFYRMKENICKIYYFFSELDNICGLGIFFKRTLNNLLPTYKYTTWE